MTPIRTTAVACLLGLTLVAARPLWAQDDDPERRGPRDEPREKGEPGWDEGRDPRPPRGPDGREPGPDGREPGFRPPRLLQPPGMEQRLGADEIAKVEAFLKEFDPGRLEKFQHVKRQNPEMYERVLREAWFEMGKLERMKQEDPERYQRMVNQRKLEQQVGELGGKLKKASEADKTALKAQLKDVLTQIFDMRETDRETEVKELERQVAKLKERMAKRKENKDKIINQRLSEMMGEREDFDW